MFQSVMKYSSFLYKLVGLSNFVIEEDNLVSKKFKILEKIPSFFIPITSVIVTLGYLITSSQDTSKTTSYLSKMILFFEIATSCYFVIISNIRKFHFKESFKKINECEIDLNKFLPSYRSQNRACKLNIVFLINFGVFLGVLTCFHVCNVGADISYYTYYNSIYTVVLIYIITLTFTLYAIKLDQQLQCANEILENIIQLDDATDIILEQSVTDDLENFFSKICSLVGTIGSYFQIYFLGCLAYSTFQPLWSLYYVIVNFPNKTNSIVIAYIYWSGIQYFPINQWVWALTSVKDQMSKLNNNFYKLARMLPDTRFYEMATSITLKFFGRKSNDAVAGVFPIDWTLNTWMTSTIISYLVIILQFRIQESAPDAPLTS